MIICNVFKPFYSILFPFFFWTDDDIYQTNYDNQYGYTEQELAAFYEPEESLSYGSILDRQDELDMDVSDMNDYIALVDCY